MSSTRFADLYRTWAVFVLAVLLMIFVGSTIVLSISVYRKYTPKVITKTVTKEVLVKSPEHPPEPATKLNDRQIYNEKLGPLKITREEVLDCFAEGEFGRKLEFERVPGSSFQYWVKPEFFNLGVDKNQRGQVVVVSLMTSFGNPGPNRTISDEIRRLTRFEVAFQQIVRRIVKGMPKTEFDEFRTWLGNNSLIMNSKSSINRNGYKLQVHVVTREGFGSLVTFSVERDPLSLNDDEAVE